MKEQRKFIRHDVRHLIDFSTTDSRGERTSLQMGRVLDMSLGGLKIEIPIDLEVKTRLEITAGIEDELIDLVGIVTHAQKDANHYIAGVKTLSISPENRFTITSYIEKMLRQRDDSTESNKTDH